MDKLKPKVGLSRRDMEWVVEGMLRSAPKDPALMARALCDLMMALIEKNNAALARSMNLSSNDEEKQK
jgi:hypothetical protein